MFDEGMPAHWDSNVSASSLLHFNGTVVWGEIEGLQLKEVYYGFELGHLEEGSYNLDDEN